MLRNKKYGFSLVELVIVLAISSLLMVMVGGFYAQRRSVASDDAVQQMVSQIQTVQNETKSNLGPSSNTSFSSGETFYGEAIEFSNTECSSTGQSCMIVHKLKASPDGQSFRSYEQYELPSSQGLFYYKGVDVTTGCAATGFVSCFTNTDQDKTIDYTNYWIVFRNGTGKSFYLNTTTTCANPDGSFKTSCDTLTRQATIRQAVTDSNSGTVGDVKYFVKIEMLNGNTVTSSKYTGASAPTPGFK